MSSLLGWNMTELCGRMVEAPNTFEQLGIVTTHPRMIIPVLAMFFVPFFLTLVIAIATDSVARKNFWKIFIIPYLVMLIILLLGVVFPVLYIYV